ncbi:MAG: hypothetical protein BRD30_02640 [Bacteroidetes bacterium QH_2_63_10]|nr:MAG: hypothetical protein BRD30_02640 [Bacteroidetes bacterium QH_2_63_10]
MGFFAGNLMEKDTIERTVAVLGLASGFPDRVCVPVMDPGGGRECGAVFKNLIVGTDDYYPE